MGKMYKCIKHIYPYVCNACNVCSETQILNVFLPKMPLS